MSPRLGSNVTLKCPGRSLKDRRGEREHLENCSSFFGLPSRNDPISPCNGRGSSLSCAGLFGQATKGVWWMPWGQEPRKGVAHDVTLRGGASSLRSGDARMGKPGTGDAVSPTVRGRRPGELKHLITPRNRKQSVILLVAASERGSAQTVDVPSVPALRRRGRGTIGWGRYTPHRVTKSAST